MTDAMKIRMAVRALFISVRALRLEREKGEGPSQ